MRCGLRPICFVISMIFLSHFFTLCICFVSFAYLLNSKVTETKKGKRKKKKE